LWQAEEIVANAGAADVTYVPIQGAPHYLEGHRREALATVADWLAKRFP
jgi:alpha-beta hydrolase superfamily lysophospholipase